MTPNRDQIGRRPRRLWLWIGYWVGMFVVTHVPIVPPGPLAVRHGDKVIHFGLYFLLTTLGGRYWLATRRRAPIVALLIWAAVYAAYGGADEWLQDFVGRTGSTADWLANVAGIMAATAMLALRRRSAGLSEQRGEGR